VEALGPILNLPAQLYDLHLQALDAALELQAMAAFLPRLCGEGGRRPLSSSLFTYHKYTENQRLVQVKTL
jgi:hypothetical protein